MSTPILYSQAEGCAEIALHRPECRNALSLELLQAMAEKLETVRRDATIKLLVLRGSNSTFCAGADLKQLSESRSREERELFFKVLADVLQRMQRLPQPILCVVEGFALAGALGLVAASDLVLSETSAQFGLPELKVGLVPMVIMPYLIRAMGFRGAQFLALSAEVVSAQRAQQLGLVHEVLDSTELKQREDSLRKQILQLAPRSLRKTKELLRTIDKPGVCKGLPREVARWSLLEEASDGMQAVLEKRKPAWRT